ncbi:hypothetical protein I862_03495 [endosymbiont of Acanthamoeba sp. UWC8]|nr:hypothetical protein I862_03495 [endosymbiont of Acanthamoeba sp. UWC8]
MDHFIDILNFLQAISWPIVAFFIFKYFANPLRNIMVSVNDAVHERGLKVSSPQGVDVEIPGNQEEVGDIKEFVTKAVPQKYMKTGQIETTPLEPLQETTANSPQSAEEVVRMHEISLVNDIYFAINTFLEENEDKESEKELLKGLLCDAYISLYFERTYQIILPSQLALLKKLASAEDKTIDSKEISSIFKLHEAGQPKISSEKLIDFLQKSGLTKKEKNRIKLTNEGKEFLDYISARGYAAEKIK